MHAAAKVRWVKAQVPYRHAPEGIIRVDHFTGIVAGNLSITHQDGWKVSHVPSGWGIFWCFRRRDAKAICEALIADHDLTVFDRAAATPDGSLGPEDKDASDAIRRTVVDMQHRLFKSGRNNPHLD
jgi:hypothetical protein